MSGIMMMLVGTGGSAARVAATYTYSANTANASLNITSLSGYSAGNTDVTITVNSGIYIYSTSIATPALTLTGGSTGDTVTLVNNGYIMGRGGDGLWRNASGATGGQSTVGGNAISLGFNTTINNTNASAYIGGGGGGGVNNQNGLGGGGAGGGIGGYDLSNGINSVGSASIGTSGANGNYWANKSNYLGGGGGGGRIFPGTGGAGGNSGAPYGKGGSAGGGGGSDSWMGSGGYSSGAGGSGNSNSANTVYGGSGGGGWGASSGNVTGDSVTGKAGGKAVALNGKTVTWTSGNTTRVYGAVS